MIVVLMAAKMDVDRTPLTEPPAVVLGWLTLRKHRVSSSYSTTPTVSRKSRVDATAMPRFVVVVALGSVVVVIVSVIVSVMVLVIVCVMVMVTEVVIVAVMDIVVVVVSVALAKVANKAAAA